MASVYPVAGPGEILDTLAPYSMWIRFVLGAAILLFAVGTDLRFRRVPNEAWLVPLIAGAGLAIYDWTVGDPALVYLALVPILMGFAYLLWRFRLLFGGADAKCVMAFALLVPFPPALLAGDGTLYPHLPGLFPTALTMLTNAVLFTLLVPVFFFLSNLVRGHFHPLAMFLGTRMPLARVASDPVWVMDWVKPAPGKADAVAEGPALDATAEDPDLDDDALPHVDPATLEGATVVLRYMPTRAGDYALNLARLSALNVKTVWATPKIPFMIPLFFGFLAAFLVGDLIYAGTLWAMGRL